MSSQSSSFAIPLRRVCLNEVLFLRLRSPGTVLMKFHFHNSAQKRLSSQSSASETAFTWECIHEVLLPHFCSEGNVFTMFCFRNSAQKEMSLQSSASATPLCVIPFHNSALQGNIIAKFRFRISISGWITNFKLFSCSLTWGISLITAASKLR